MTREGLKCRPWNTRDLGSINYCRHPDPTNEKLDNDGPWCYTEGDHTIWGYCDVRHCHDEKKTTPRTSPTTTTRTSPTTTTRTSPTTTLRTSPTTTEWFKDKDDLESEYISQHKWYL